MPADVKTPIIEASAASAALPEIGVGGAVVVVCIDTDGCEFDWIWIEERRAGNLDGRVVVKTKIVWLTLGDAGLSTSSDLERSESDEVWSAISCMLETSKREPGVAAPPTTGTVEMGNAEEDNVMVEIDVGLATLDWLVGKGVVDLPLRVAMAKAASIMLEEVNDNKTSF